MLGRLWYKLVQGALLPALGLDEYRSRLKQVEDGLKVVSDGLEELSNRIAKVEEFIVQDEAHSGT